MIKIQTMADIQALQKNKDLPSFYIEEIKYQFSMWYEADNDGESLYEFCLPPYSCIYHFDKATDINVFTALWNEIEYVDVEKINGQKYFRIGIMHDHEMSIIYALEKTLPRRIGQLLESEGE
ncbi:hypothetical protein [Pseudogracilibacillus sp. SO10305]|uniref:hypothetical protein n=1 Tax=Pseudogracilibacillus sp. SO10305 TaxID=3098292 RepID=UPI00300E07BD